MRCKVKGISVAKKGNTANENEDAFLIPSYHELNSENTLKFAIADGATESTFSREWAKLLVEFYKSNQFTPDTVNSTLDLARTSWIDRIARKELPWYAEEKKLEGSHSTLLGVTISFDRNEWKGFAIGDSNLFVISKDELVSKFPIEKSREFSRSPYLISTNNTQNSQIVSKIRQNQGEIHAGDILILATDAIAKWHLEEAEKGSRPWSFFCNILNSSENADEDFNNWLNNKRKEKEIQNDDTTLIIIEIN